MCVIFLSFLLSVGCIMISLHRCTLLKVHGHQNCIYFVYFPKSAKCCDNFDSNIGIQRFVNTEKFTFEIDSLLKSRRKTCRHIGM